MEPDRLNAEAAAVLAGNLRDVLESVPAGSLPGHEALIGQCDAVCRGDVGVLPQISSTIWGDRHLRFTVLRQVGLLTRLRQHARPQALPALTDLILDELRHSALQHYATVQGNLVWIPVDVISRSLACLEINAYGYFPGMEGDPTVSDMLTAGAPGWRGWVQSWLGWVNDAPSPGPPALAWASTPRFLTATRCCGVRRSDRSMAIWDAVRSRPTQLVALSEDPQAIGWLPDTIGDQGALGGIMDPEALQCAQGVGSVQGLMQALRMAHPTTAMASLLASVASNPQRSRRRAVWDLLVEIGLSSSWCGAVGDDGIWMLEVNPFQVAPYAFCRYRDRLVVSSTFPGSVACQCGLIPTQTQHTVGSPTSPDLHGLIRAGWWSVLQVAEPVELAAVTTIHGPWLTLPADVRPPDWLPQVRGVISATAWDRFAALVTTPTADELVTATA